MIPRKKTFYVYVGLSVLLLALFTLSRFTDLTKLPIFTDEAIYIRWSQIGSRDANWRFISLTDGKQPLFTWIMMVFLRIIPGDPLFVGRSVSVLAGFLSIIGIWLLTNELFRNKRISFIAVFLYIICPFTLMYDKLALYDSLVGALSVWNLYIAILLVRHPRLDLSLIFGMTLGAGMLNKTSGFLSLYLLPVTLLAFDWSLPGRTKRFMKWILFVGFSAALSQLFYSVLRLSPYFHMIGLKDKVFVYSLTEWFAHPVKFLSGNLHGLFDWLINYLTKPVFIASILALFSFKAWREKLLLYAWWIIPFLALASFGRVLYPRFVLFMSLPLLILAANSLEWFIARWGKTVFGIVFMVVILLQSIFTSYLIVTNPLVAPFPHADKGQLIDDWPAGGGVKEVNAFFLKESQKGKIVVYTEGTFGLMPYAVEIYLVDKPNIEIHGIWPLPMQLPVSIETSASLYPTYLILNESQEPPSLWPLELIAAYQKGNRQDRALRLFKIILPRTLSEDSLSIEL